MERQEYQLSEDHSRLIVGGIGRIEDDETVELTEHEAAEWVDRGVLEPVSASNENDGGSEEA